MRICQLKIDNFRGVKTATLHLPTHIVLIGDNNTGKSTVLEALDLALGPDRLARRPPVDEHDFYCGKYLPEPNQTKEATAQPDGGGPVVADDVPVAIEPPAMNAPPIQPVQVEPPAPAVAGKAPTIRVEVIIIGLNAEQSAHFNHYLEWWDTANSKLYASPPAEGVDAAAIEPALRVTFIGGYDPAEDDFEGKTFFSRSLEEDPSPEQFKKRDKQICGFLYLRSIRTGSRALSLEHGSLLDIILRLKEIRPQMWEGTISSLSSNNVASDPKIGISGVLQSINAALKKYVPREWGADPHLKVSALTRDHLRKVITAFIATGDGDHAAPYFRQGTGTLNMLVLAMLTQIAEGKQNVIFAMEEPETAIPPYAQKRIVHGVRELSSQTFFTSHSPYVLEEFELEETLILARGTDGILKQATVTLPSSVKVKRYRQEFRTRFCEGLLARRILLAEGATEATAIPVAARRLNELNPSKYSSLEQLGICTIDAGSDSQLSDLGGFYRSLGKTVYAACDKQSAASEAQIKAHVDKLFMHDKDDIEKLVLEFASIAALHKFSDIMTWPPHLLSKYTDPKVEIKKALSEYFNYAKGNWGLADFLATCAENDIPPWIKDMCVALKELCAPSMPEVAADAP